MRFSLTLLQLTVFMLFVNVAFYLFKSWFYYGDAESFVLGCVSCIPIVACLAFTQEENGAS